jgi:hypothetical protein
MTPVKDPNEVNKRKEKVKGNGHQDYPEDKPDGQKEVV